MNNDLTMSRRNLLAFGAAAGVSHLALPAVASAAGTAPVVVELFTSQGCSSCPPADALLNELRANPGVLALSYHVDYWDYLGWRDTLGSAEYSQRQYDYAKSRGDMDVYTPQIVINGTDHVVGSRKSAVTAAIDAARKQKWAVPVNIGDTAKEIIIDIGDGAAIDEATLWVMPILTETAVKIERGEIAGHEMAYHNVVRRLVPAGMWSGKAVRLSLPKDGLVPPDCKACVALLQKGKVGPILGAASWGQIGA